VVDKDGKTTWGYHSDNFEVYKEEEEIVDLNP